MQGKTTLSSVIMRTNANFGDVHQARPASVGREDVLVGTSLLPDNCSSLGREKADWN